MLTYSLFKWFYNRFFHFSVHNEPWSVKKNVDVLMKKYEKNFEMTNKKMFILKLLLIIFFCNFFSHVFFFTFVANMGISTIWITFNVVIELMTDANELQIWIITYSIEIIVSLLFIEIAWTVRGDSELITEFHRFFYQIDCFHSDIDFDSKCRIREISHHFEMMKNKMKIFYWFLNVDCV